jgi:hypothetical protein
MEVAPTRGHEATTISGGGALTFTAMKTALTRSDWCASLMGGI